MVSRSTFPAGLELEARKAAPMRQPLRAAPVPPLLVMALDQGSGDAAQPLLKAGARVRVGTPVGRAVEETAVAVHSPVAGVVRGVEIRPVPGPAGEGACVVIENDGSDEIEEGYTSIDWPTLPPHELLAQVRNAGIAGLGGAAFPAHAKLAAARERSATHLVLNGAECEPWICCDDVLMRERAAEVVLGARVMLHACGASRCTIAVEDDKPEAIAALTAALAAVADPRIELAPLRAVYPAGAERQLLAAITGLEVPHDALPPAIGLMCQNVGTAAAVARLVATGQPLTRRIVTVTGSGIRQPANLEARIGTPIADLIAACGGYDSEPLRLIAGGSMTGRALATDAVPLTQAVNCVFVATAADLAMRGREMPCIRCGNCASVCPPGLLPQSLLRAIAAGDDGQVARHGLADCIECGCCDYVCPSQIPLTARFRAAREERRQRLDERRRAADARERFRRHEERLAAAADADRRAFEAARSRARGERKD
jgi:electron transport complex protein RnfC